MEKALHTATIEDLMSPEYQHMRVKIQQSCENLFSSEEWGQKSIDLLWRGCYYLLVNVIRHSELSVEQKRWAEILFSVFCGELDRLIYDYPQYRSVLYIYLGDIRRYSWHLLKRDRHRAIAIIHYKDAYSIDSRCGIALNQLGLIYQEENPIAGLLLFLLAQTSPRPFQGAFANILGVLARPQVENDLSLSIVGRLLTSFRRIEHEELCRRWYEELRACLEDREVHRVTQSLFLFTLTAVLLSKREKETELRCLCETVLEAASVVVETLDKWDNSKDLIAEKRRRRSISETSSENDIVELSDSDERSGASGDREPCKAKGGESEVSEDKESSVDDELPQISQHQKSLLVSLLYICIELAESIYADHLPSAVRKNFETLCQSLINVLNTLMPVFDRSCPLSTPLWHMAGSSPWILLSRMLTTFVESPRTPVYYNEFFRFQPSKSSQESLMKNMGKLLLAHETREEEVKASLPVYVVPEEDVLMERLDIIKGIVAKSELIVVIPKCVLQSMDAQKQKNYGAREAIRWIEAQLSCSTNRLRLREASSVARCAQNLVEKTPISTPVIVSILNLSEKSEESSIKEITIENAEHFSRRCFVAIGRRLHKDIASFTRSS
ncbi:hypothetical protein AB6A40_003969 [Gnathostoma spinigerum]|uniref:EST1-like DNA-binding domain-containing protein n=1 Tax=Gnathostoma spinigerum TaxID=75299 RepID=A0ABD6EC93_9BILA